MTRDVTTARRMTALAGVLSRYAGMDGGMEFARNFAMCALSSAELGEPFEAATVLREMLEIRRENWPGRWEGRLTNSNIAIIAAEGGQAWERAGRGKVAK